MTGVFRQALGAEFDRLHPQLQKRFGISSETGVACVGSGVMDRIWRGPAFTVPFLWIGAWRNILVPRVGTNVPFTVDNYPYVDRYGRETVTFVRTFELPNARRGRFDATMIYSNERHQLIDYLGTHQHLAVELELEVDAAGGLVIRSGAQRFYERAIAFRFPQIATGVAEVRESYDDELQRFRISVKVVNRWFGPLFGYDGTFTCTYPVVGPAGVPVAVKPVRDERRD